MRVTSFSMTVQNGVRDYIDKLMLYGEQKYIDTLQTHERNLRIEKHLLTYCGMQYDLYRLYWCTDLISEYFDGILLEYGTPDQNVSPITYEYITNARSLFLSIVRDNDSYTATILRVSY